MRETVCDRDWNGGCRKTGNTGILFWNGVLEDLEYYTGMGCWDIILEMGS